MNLIPDSVTATGVGDRDLAVRCTSTTVLITAFSSADVEKIALRIHAAGMLALYPLVRVSARALPCDPATLATRCRTLFAAAAGGTVLLANVEETPVPAQRYLLNHLEALQNRGTAAAVRVMAGTTQSLTERVASGAFSEELFYQLNPIHLVVADLSTRVRRAAADGLCERPRRFAIPNRVVL